MLRQRIKIVLIALPLLALLSGQESAEIRQLDRQIGTRQGELDRLREEIRLYERRITDQAAAEKSTLNALYELEEHISLTSRLVQAINGQIALLSDSISRAEQLISDGEEEIATLKRNLSERFVHIYKQRRASALELILTAQDWHQASYRGKYLRVAADYDRFLTERVKTEIARLEARKLQLAQDRDQQSRLLAEKELEERDLQRNKEKRRRQILQIKRDRRQDERLLLQKKQAAVQMERIIKSLLFDRERRAAELTAIRAAREDEEAPDISFYKGRLPWPTVGTVVNRFGRHRNPKMGTITESPGIDILGHPGAIVTATLSGLITTITYIRGYGTTVIIDHGKDLYTVYALLEDVQITEGQYVDQGQIIAHVGSNSSLEGSKLHFEVWTNQLKQNPEDWLSKPLARR